MSDCNYCKTPLNTAKYALVNDKVYKSCPKCSQNTNNGEHAYYACPLNFGTTSARVSTNSPIGIQSQCNKCRSGNNVGPYEDALYCREIDEKNGYIIGEVRTLPMSKDVFETHDDVKEFILNTLPNRGGLYYYKTRNMKCDSNAFVMFQYDAHLVGYGVCVDTVPFENVNDEGYSGYYQFDPETLVYLEKPVSKDDYAKMDSSFTSFGQASLKKDAAFLPAMYELFKGNTGNVRAEVNEISFPGEITEEEIGNYTEGGKKQITVNAYERNPKARKACINHYRKKNNGRLKCEICGFDFGEVYGDGFMDKMHVHHLVEVHTRGEEYVLNPIEDLIPICPNCHMIAHSRKIPYTPDEIREMLKKSK